MLLSKRADRTLSPRGIELGGMFYTSDELMALRSELASHNLDADRVAVRYNPWDLGEVWVLNPIDVPSPLPLLTLAVGCGSWYNQRRCPCWRLPRRCDS